MAKTKTAPPKAKLKKAPSKAKAKKPEPTATVVPIDSVLEPDMADVDPGTGEGEYMAPLSAETWVVLDGSAPEINDPDLDNKYAALLQWPTLTKVDPRTGVTSEYLPEEALVTVRELRQGRVLSNLPLSAFKEIHTHGRPPVIDYA